jgi:hypothetical protein
MQIELLYKCAPACYTCSLLLTMSSSVLNSGRIIRIHFPYVRVSVLCHSGKSEGEQVACRPHAAGGRCVITFLARPNYKWYLRINRYA